MQRFTSYLVSPRSKLCRCNGVSAFSFLMAIPGGYPEISHSNLHFLRGFPSYVSTSRLSFRSCFRDFKAFIWGRWEFPVAEMGICHFANWHRSGKTMERLRKTMVSLATSMSVYRTVNAKLICEWGSFHWHDEQKDMVHYLTGSRFWSIHAMPFAGNRIWVPSNGTWNSKIA